MASVPASPAGPEPGAREFAALRRDRDRGLAGGVLAGIAGRFSLEPVAVRIAFVAGVVLSGGALLIPYALCWALIPVGGAGQDASASRGFRERSGRGWHLGAGVGLLTLAALLVFRELGIWWSDQLVWPLVLVSAGLALLWGQSRSAAAREELPAPGYPTGDSPQPAAPRSPESSFAALYRGGFGVALVVGAGLLFLSANDALGAARDAAFTAIVAIVALALVLAPFIWRLGRNLAVERGERIRSQERAEVAAHLHDSVLQTLALVQKRAGDPREVSALARRQERELRDWLVGGSTDGAGAGGVAAALRAAAAEIEDSHRVAIEVVAVGDCELDPASQAVVAAAREAMINAAKFAPDGPISLYAELGVERIEVYVRDRGAGFDPAAVPEDRRGVRDSIIARMKRHGGTAAIRPAPGSGMEVELTVQRQRSIP